MLSDRDRETLDDMERELLVGDPKLSNRFQSAWKNQRIRHEAAQTRSSWLLALAIGCALLLGAFAILFGAPGQAAAYGVLAGSLAVVRRWLHLQAAPS